MTCKEQFEQMLTFCRKAKTKEEMEQIVTKVFLFDLSYHREDILKAMKIVEREMGWK